MEVSHFIRSPFSYSTIIEHSGLLISSHACSVSLNFLPSTDLAILYDNRGFIISPPRFLSRDSVVSIATGYELDDRGIGVRVPVRSRIFSSANRPELL
jgi:hypothetical protein